MGETVSFPSNGSNGTGYLAVPASGSGAGVVVMQEWWGLNDQIRGMADRLVGEGFVALVPTSTAARTPRSPTRPPRS